MPEWIILSAVKALKLAIMGVVSLTTCCEHPTETPAAAPAIRGASPRTGTAVMMRELGACDLPKVEAVPRLARAENIEVVMIIQARETDAA